jgi:hypothetical protein
MLQTRENIPWRISRYPRVEIRVGLTYVRRVLLVSLVCGGRREAKACLLYTSVLALPVKIYRPQYSMHECIKIHQMMHFYPIRQWERPTSSQDVL